MGRRAQCSQGDLRGHQQAGVRNRAARQGGGCHVHVRPGPSTTSAGVGPIGRRAISCSIPQKRSRRSSGGDRSCVILRPPVRSTTTSRKSPASFSRGRAAMVYDDITFTTLFSTRRNLPSRGKFGTSVARPARPRRTGAANPPITPTSTGLAISSLSKKKEAAWLLVQLLSDKTSRSATCCRVGSARGHRPGPIRR